MLGQRLDSKQNHLQRGPLQKTFASPGFREKQRCPHSQPFDSREGLLGKQASLKVGSRAMPSHPGRGSKGTWAALGSRMVRVEGCREKRHKPCPKKGRGAAMGVPFTTLPQRALDAQLRQPHLGLLLHPPPCFLLLPMCCCDLDARPTSHSPRRADGPGARGQPQVQLPPSEHAIKRTGDPSKLTAPHSMTPCGLVSCFPPLWSWDPSIQPPATWSPLPPLPTTETLWIPSPGSSRLAMAPA